MRLVIANALGEGSRAIHRLQKAHDHEKARRESLSYGVPL